MNLDGTGQFRIIPNTTQGRLLLGLEGTFDAGAAWEVIKRLEAYEREVYPITLDFKGVWDIHWLAVSILTRGLEYVSKTRGSVLLAVPGNAIEVFSAKRLAVLLGQSEKECS